MKWIKQVCIAVSFSAVAGGLATAETVPVIEKPSVLPEAMLSITAADVHGLLDGVGTVAAQVSPMMNGMMLKGMLGMQLGDPSLAGIAPGKGFAVVALDPTNIFAVIEVTEAQSVAYAGVLTSTGLQSKYGNGLLVVAQTTEQAEKGSALAAAVQGKLLATRSPDLRVAMQPSAMIERNKEQIDGFMQMMPVMMGAGMMQSPGVDTNMVANTTRILEGELRVLLSMASQCESGEVVISPANGSLRISETYVPKAGTRLAALTDAPQLNKSNPKIQSGLLGGGTMLLDCTIGNPDALAEFIVSEAQKVIVEMKIKDVDVADLLKNMKKWMGIYGGSFCESVDFGTDGGFNVSYLMEVKDAKGAMELFRTMEQDMAPFMKLYENLGMPMCMTFKENVRQYKGVNIHQFSVKMDMKNMAEEQRKQFETMGLGNMTYEMAITDGVMLYAMGDNAIESLMDRLEDGSATGKPLKARSVYPEGGFYYFDFDIGSYMGFVSSMMPQGPANPMTQMADLLKGASPLTSAGFKADGRVMWSLNIPGDLIAKYGQIIVMMKMQQGGAPQSAPPQ